MACWPRSPAWRRCCRAWLACWTLLLAGTLAHAATPEAMHLLVAEMLTEATVGFAAPPYAIAPGAPVGGWRSVPLPHAPRLLGLQRGNAQARPGDATPTQLTWYRLRVPPLPAAPAAGGARFLYIPRWKSDGLIGVYGDGRLLYQSHSHSQWNGSERPLMIALDAYAGVALPREIVIRMQHVAGAGGALSSVWVGTEAAIGWRFQLREALQVRLPAIANAAWMALGVFALLVWLKRHRDPIYLYFFLIAALSYLHRLNNPAGSARLPVADAWFDWLTINAGFWKMAVAYLFITHVRQHVQPRMARLVAGTIVAAALLTLPLAGLAQARFAVPLAYLSIMLVANVVFGVGLVQFWRLRLREGVLLTGWALLSLESGVYDFLMRSNLVGIEGVYLNPYADAGAFLIFSYVMYTRYIRAHEEVARTNAGLAERLRARDIELTRTHEQLRAAEQDALLDRERQRMTEDMHDGLGSSLVSALRVVERGRLDAGQMAAVLRDCIDDLKLAIDSMEVVDADLLLLLATLRFRLAPRLDSAGIALRWDIVDVPPLDWLTPGAALHILRILQEAITNIIKHAGASEIRVATAVDADSEAVLVSVGNDGAPFDLARALASGGKGLNNQLRRAGMIGATLQWESCAGATGVATMLLRLPLRQSARPGV
ncbi:sensor histidine kinase [Massilia sp. DWR3-1-1]|uniref:sensor histidine kinase n=1 Tax=Massilia sp. DWR3-1-1 TaxID=2804559 RepID=UPI003CF43E13